jgi:hypothetical protein
MKQLIEVFGGKVHDLFFWESHAVIDIDIALRDIGEFAAEQSFFERAQVIGHQNAFNVVVLVLHDARGKSIQFFLVQIPVFFGFYSMLGTAIELRNSHFLWIHDLSQPGATDTYLR